MLRLILIGLIAVLIIVIIVSYHKTKEGFESLQQSLEESVNDAITDVGSGATQLTGDIANATESDTKKGEKPEKPGKPEKPTKPSKKVEKDDNQSEIVISGPGFDAMGLQQKADLLKNIQKLIKNEAIVDRQTTLVAPETPDSCNSDALQQGKEYSSECQKGATCPPNKDGTCPPVPDMSEYIKKDQIPCWGCTLDY